MAVVSEVCPSCGAPISVASGISRMQCPYCTTSLTIARHGQDVALEIAGKLTSTIKESGAQTNDAIRDGTYVTQSELRRLQVTQELSMVQLQLSNVRSEIRSLKRLPDSRVIRDQLRELQKQEVDLTSRAKQLTEILNPSPVVAAQPPKAAAATQPINPIFWAVVAAVLIISVTIVCMGSFFIMSNDSTRVTPASTVTTGGLAGNSEPQATLQPAVTSQPAVILQPVATASLATTSTGHLSFFEGNNATQEIVCTLQAVSTTLNFKSSNVCKNDEARSVVLTNLVGGSTIRLFDSPDCLTTDDWTKILVKKATTSYVIGTFEESFEDETIRSTYYSDNGLDGKVSCINIVIP